MRRALRKLGADIRDARRRRRIPVAIMAERASISRTTLNKIEKGEPGVSIGAYATVLFTLGLADRLAGLADASADVVGSGPFHSPEGYFELTAQDLRRIAAEVGQAVGNWRAAAAAVGLPPPEIRRMASAFDHQDLKAALAM